MLMQVRQHQTSKAQHADLTAVVLAAVVGRQQCSPKPLLLIFFSFSAALAKHGCHRRPEAAHKAQALHGHDSTWTQEGVRVLRKTFSPSACCQVYDAALPGQGIQALKRLKAVQQVPADSVRHASCCHQVAATVLLPGQGTRRWWTGDCTAGAYRWANS